MSRNLGEVLRKWRLMSELSCTEVAARMGISHSTLLRIEANGEMDGLTLAKILVWLLGNEVRENASTKGHGKGNGKKGAPAAR